MTVGGKTEDDGEGKNKRARTPARGCDAHCATHCGRMLHDREMVLQPYTDKQREPVEKSKRLRIRMGTICRLNNLRLSENRFLKRGNVGFDI